MTTSGAGPWTAPAEAAGCAHPGDALNLTNWKLQLPRPGAGSGVVEIKQPQLDTFTESPFFRTQGCAVAFRAPINGAHTSGSHFARSELREMTNGGRTEASWSSTSGTHTFNETVAFTATPKGKPDVVGAQIHNATEDISLLVLRGSELYVTNAATNTSKLVTGSYRLGTKVDMKWVVSGGVTTAWVNGNQVLSFKRAYQGAFFKAGAYPQADCAHSSPCDDSNYGSTVITRLSTSHGGGGGTSASDISNDTDGLAHRLPLLNRQNGE